MARFVWVTAAVTVLAAPAGALSASPAYSFGREGGNIVPFTVTVAPDGEVHVSGPVKVGRPRVTAAQLASLAEVAARARFSTLPSATACPGTLPDLATTWIEFRSRIVRVHGSCSARFTLVWNALTTALRLSYG